MLLDLSIDHLRILQRISINFQDGMTCLTGESGSGKSMIAYALKLLCGERFERNTTQETSKNTTIHGLFDIAHHTDAKDWLLSNEFELDTHQPTCLIKRVITPQNISKAYINGQPCTLKQLKIFTQTLITIHGQHFYHQLLNPIHHLSFVDQGMDKTLLKNAKLLAQQYNALLQEKNNATNQHEQTMQRIDFLTYQLEEFNQLNLKNDDFSNIEHEYLLQQSKLKHQDIIQSILHRLKEQPESALNLLQKSIQDLQQTNSVEFDPLVQQLTNAQNECEHSAEMVKDFFTGDSSNETENTKNLEVTMDSINQLAFKHRCKIEDLGIIQSNYQDELMKLKTRTQDAQSSEKTLTLLLQKYKNTSQKLSEERLKMAKNITHHVQQMSEKLNLSGMLCIQHSTKETKGYLSETGTDEFEWMISHAQHPPLSLAKTASGGELSRLALALEIATLSTEKQCLLFDEVDAGIGGVTAQAVATYLQKLSDTHQVICITHSAQVASKAKQHWLVQKQIHQQNIRVEVHALDDKRVEEIARMISGDEITNITIQQAQQMLEH